MAPVAAGERPEPAALDEGLQPLAHCGEMRGAGLRVFRQRLGQDGRLLRVGFQRAGHVHPVERVQVVEVHDVIMDVLAGGDEVAQQPGVHRRVDVERGFDRTDRGERMHRRTHPADALREVPSVPRVAADEDLLQAAPHRGGRPGLGDLPAVDLRLDAQMPFDAGDRVYDDAIHVRPRPGVLGLPGTP